MITEEQWRPVPDFPNYEISDRCRARNTGTGYVLRPVFDPRSGYVRYCFRYNGRQLTKNAHRVMWIAFRGDIAPGLQINHIDGNTRNNDWANLELVTPRQNTQHAWDNGLIAHKGFAKNPRKKPAYTAGRRTRGGWKLSPKDIDDIRAALAVGVKHKLIAANKGVSIKTISHIKCGRRHQPTRQL